MTPRPKNIQTVDPSPGDLIGYEKQAMWPASVLAAAFVIYKSYALPEGLINYATYHLLMPDGMIRRVNTGDVFIIAGFSAAEDAVDA